MFLDSVLQDASEIPLVVPYSTVYMTYEGLHPPKNNPEMKVDLFGSGGTQKFQWLRQNPEALYIIRK
jgi:hypothetical protein